MSKRSSRYSNPKFRKSKSEHEADKSMHQYKKDHHKKVLEKLGLDKILV